MAASLRRLFRFPAFSRIGFANFETLFPSLQKRGRQIIRAWRENWLVQELGDGRLPGGKTRAGGLDGPPKLVQTHTGAAYFQRIHSVTQNEFSSPASWWKWRMWIKPVLFNNLILMWFPWSECRDWNYLYMLKFVGVQEPVAKTLNYLLQVWLYVFFSPPKVGNSGFVYFKTNNNRFTFGAFCVSVT